MPESVESIIHAPVPNHALTSDSKKSFLVFTFKRASGSDTILQKYIRTLPASAIYLYSFDNKLIDEVADWQNNRNAPIYSQLLTFEDSGTNELWKLNRQVALQNIEQLKQFDPDLFCLKAAPHLNIESAFVRYIALSKLSTEMRTLIATKNFLANHPNQLSGQVLYFTQLLPVDFIQEILSPVLDSRSLIVCTVRMRSTPQSLKVSIKKEPLKKLLDFPLCMLETSIQNESTIREINTALNELRNINTNINPCTTTQESVKDSHKVPLFSPRRDPDEDNNINEYNLVRGFIRNPLKILPSLIRHPRKVIIRLFEDAFKPSFYKYYVCRITSRLKRQYYNIRKITNRFKRQYYNNIHRIKVKLRRQYYNICSIKGKLKRQYYYVHGVGNRFKKELRYLRGNGVLSLKKIQYKLRKRDILLQWRRGLSYSEKFPILPESQSKRKKFKSFTLSKSSSSAVGKRVKTAKSVIMLHVHSRNHIRIKLLKPVISRLLYKDIPVKLYIYNFQNADYYFYDELLGETICFHPLFTLKFIQFGAQWSLRQRKAYSLLFHSPEKLLIGMKNNSEFSNSGKILNYNNLILYSHVLQSALVLHSMVKSTSANHLLSVMDVHLLTLLSQLRDYHKLPLKIHAMQFGVANYNYIMDKFDVDNFFVTDSFAQTVYKEQNCLTDNFSIIGSTEWEEITRTQEESLSADILSKIETSDFVIGMFNQPLIENNLINRHLCLNYYQALYRFLDKFPTTSLLIKLHYRNDKALCMELIPKHPNIFVLPPNISNMELFQHIDLAASFYSFVLASALANGIPALAFTRHKNFFPFLNFIEQTGGYAARTPEDVYEWLSSLYEDSEQRQLLKSKVERFHCSIKENPPSQQIVDILYNN